MQNTFRCYRCGAENLIGEGHCAGCGQLLPYTCPQCRYPVNNALTNCPYCYTALHWPNRQQSRSTYGGRAASQGMSNSLFACSRCGSQNVIGASWCRNCSQQFNYTCPDCKAWVNNTLVNCPNCRRVLRWPAERELQGRVAKNSAYRTNRDNFEEPGRHKKAGRWPAVVLGVGLLFIIFFAFILGISPSTTVVSSPSAVHALSDAPRTTQQPASLTSSATSSTFSATSEQTSTPSNSSSTLSSHPDSASVPLSTSNTPASVPAAPVPAPSNTGAWNKAADHYLQNLEPDWGKPAAPDPNCPLCRPQ
jgi:predicted RNA-binding Zn-ribbon protein involved in translation (DUF1610 family)